MVSREENKKDYLADLVFFYYVYYKDYSVEQLISRLLELYQSDNTSNFIEIAFLEILIAIRSEN